MATSVRRKATATAAQAARTEPSAELLQQVREYGGYLEVRALADGSIAGLGELLFTRAIHLGCDVWGWSRRFCFEDRGRAVEEFAKLQSEDDTPEGWTARRPKAPGD